MTAHLPSQRGEPYAFKATIVAVAIYMHSIKLVIETVLRPVGINMISAGKQLKPLDAVRAFAMKPCTCGYCEHCARGGADTDDGAR